MALDLEARAQELDRASPFTEISKEFHVCDVLENFKPIIRRHLVSVHGGDGAAADQEMRELYHLEGPLKHYFDGNSLGPISLEAISILLIEAVRWGKKRVGAWEYWVNLAERLGDKVATLRGYDNTQKRLNPHTQKIESFREVLVTDDVSTNVYKITEAFAAIGYNRLVTNKENFPSDRYILEGIEKRWKNNGIDMKRVDMAISDPEKGLTPQDLERTLQGLEPGTKALVVYSAVDFKTGHWADVESLKRVADKYGAELLQDDCHALGARDQRGMRDIAFVGCLYKYLNGGPGAPAAIGIPTRLLDNPAFMNPIQTWWTHWQMFKFDPEYTPKPDVGQFMSGTPPILSLAMAEAGLNYALRAGIDQIEQQSVILTEFAINIYDQELSDTGLVMVTPRDPARRGSHIAFRHPQARNIRDALAARGVVPDSRDDILRFAVTPLYATADGMLSGFRILGDIMRTEAYKQIQVARIVP